MKDTRFASKNGFSYPLFARQLDLEKEMAERGRAPSKTKKGFRFASEPRFLLVGHR